MLHPIQPCRGGGSSWPFRKIGYRVADLLSLACLELDVQPKASLTSGGQKLVHIVVDSSGLECVLKLIDLRQAADPVALERARREVNLLRSIDHPNIVRVISELREIGSPAVATAWLEEYLDGADLRNHLGTAWTAQELTRLGSQVAAGLGAMHEKHTIHRDLSAGNVQRLSNGDFKVMDPGFAKHTLRSGITAGGQPGTPGFMTPEHLQSYSGAPTAASDVFACAALVYYAAASRPPIPFKGDEVDYFRRLRTADHIPLKDVRKDLPDSLLSVVERGLHAQPARRYRNGNTLSKAFEDGQCL